MKKILILAVTVNLLCGSSFITAQNNIPSNLNISVLLDLSDRIDTIKYSNPSMEFYQRDLGYLKSVAKTFTSSMLTKRVMQLNDKIQLYSPTKKITYDRELIRKEFGVYPQNVLTCRIVDGDKSDGIPGIKGAGLKTLLKVFPFDCDARKKLKSSSFALSNNRKPPSPSSRKRSHAPF